MTNLSSKNCNQINTCHKDLTPLTEIAVFNITYKIPNQLTYASKFQENQKGDQLLKFKKKLSDSLTLELSH